MSGFVCVPPPANGAVVAIARAEAGIAPAPCPPGLVPQPIARYAPKGHPSHRAAPVTAPAAGLMYLYVSSAEDHANIGAGATLVQSDPGLAAGDFHSLAEIAVESEDEKQIIEVGATVDVSTNGDDQPRLFVFHWINGVGTCYNACGWVQVSTTRYPGMRVDVGATAGYQIALVDGNWWISYQGEGIGYFPGSEWSGTYTQAGLVQWFGEIAAASAQSCTEMGTGAPGADAGAARFADAYEIATDGTQVPATLGHEVTVTAPAAYTYGQSSATGFAFGGPGVPGAACCTPASCATQAAACGAPVDGCGGALDCGDCGSGGAMCGGDFQCEAAPAGADSETATTSGGCEAGDARGAAALVLAFVGVALARRRR